MTQPHVVKGNKALLNNKKGLKVYQELYKINENWINSMACVKYLILTYIINFNRFW